jgi:hypothetical protein
VPDELAALRDGLRCERPGGLARFWSGVLGRRMVDDPQDGAMVLPNEEPVPDPIRSRPRCRSPSRTRCTSISRAPPSRTSRRPSPGRSRGRRHIDIGQLPEESTSCSPTPRATSSTSSSRQQLPRRHRFHRGPGVRRLASVWVLLEPGAGWPLVWDQDEETAIQSPLGGSKITWGGPPLEPRQASTDCISTSSHPPTVTSKQRSTDSSGTRCHSHRHRPGPGELGRDGRPGWP